MLPHQDLDGAKQQLFSCSLEDECLDDIVLDLESLQQSDAEAVNSDIEDMSFQSSPGRNCPSEQSSVFSDTETLTQHSGVQVYEASDICSEEVTRDSETLSNKNEELILSSVKRIASEQRTDAQNVHGLTQPRIKEDKNKSFSRYKLPLSLHDVPRLPDFPLKVKFCDVSSDAIMNQSVTNISGLKSEDSGLPSSVNHLNLRSNRKSYGHVQSKVKEYIRKPHDVSSDAVQSQSVTDNFGLKIEHLGLPRSVSCLNLWSIMKRCDHVESKFKECISQISWACEQRKLLKQGDIRQSKEAGEKRKLPKPGDISNRSTQTDDISYVSCESNSTEVAAVLRALQHELRDRDTVLFKLYEKYDELLINYVESKNRIDELKLKMMYLLQKLATKSEKQNSNFLSAKNFALNDTNNYTSPCCKTLCVRAVDESLPSDVNGLFFNGIRASNDKTTSHEKLQSFSSSQRLDKRDMPHPGMSCTKSTEESFQEELSSKGSSDLERTSVTQSSHMCKDQHLSSAASSHKKCVCQYIGNAVTPKGETCDPGRSTADVSEFSLSQRKKCEKMPVVSEIKIPESMHGKETLLCKKSLEQIESNCVYNTSLKKVSVLCFRNTIDLPTQTLH
jgi:uncharacterized protein YbaA (DUF1428 family)